MIGSQSIALYSPDSGATIAIIGNISRLDIVSIARAIDNLATG